MKKDFIQLGAIFIGTFLVIMLLMFGIADAKEMSSVKVKPGKTYSSGVYIPKRYVSFYGDTKDDSLYVEYYKVKSYYVMEVNSKEHPGDFRYVGYAGETLFLIDTISKTDTGYVFTVKSKKNPEIHGIMGIMINRYLYQNCIWKRKG